MTHLTMLQLKISKTRKRLSDPFSNSTILVFALLCLMTLAAYSYAVLSISWSHGVVTASIPVIPLPHKNLVFQDIEIRTQGSISNETPVIFLTEKAFIFGAVSAFTKEIAAIGNKFEVPHVDSTPDMKTLIEDLKEWTEEKNALSAMLPQKIAILVPNEDMPMPIVIQVMAHLKDSRLFSDIVLGGGFKG